MPTGKEFRRNRDGGEFRYEDVFALLYTADVLTCECLALTLLATVN